ncbi:hypothetical protein BRPE67_CCDS01000 [Caballeronia cordobensis]|nr:hypothetical protein BRPE67_CCDS01000 [Burkholderia sp. RPE67]
MRVFGLLRDRDAAHLLDAQQTRRAVRPRTRHHDADRARAVRGRERREEVIDRRGRAGRARTVQRFQLPLRHLQMLARRIDIDVVLLDRGCAGDLLDGHVRYALQHFVRAAHVIRRQMDDHDERHVHVGRRVLEEIEQGFDAARRRAHADHGERQGLEIFGRQRLRAAASHRSESSGSCFPCDRHAFLSSRFVSLRGRDAARHRSSSQRSRL